MITPKNVRYILLVMLLPLTFYKAHAQNMDEKTYQHKMQLIDSLSLYKMERYDTLYFVSTLKKYHDQSYKESYCGWIDKQNQEQILFLKISGKNLKLTKKK